MSKTLTEMILRLDPVINTALATRSPAGDENSCLENNNVQLIDNADDASSVMTSAADNNTILMSGAVHRCDYLCIMAVEGGYELKTTQNNVALHEGDIIELPNSRFRVALQQQHVVAEEAPSAGVNTIPDVDDIWSTEEEYHSGAYMPDPFISHIPSVKPAVIPSIQNAHLPSTSIADVFSSPVTRPQDPLHFLQNASTTAPAQPTHFASQINTGLPPYAALLQTNNVASYPSGTQEKAADVHMNQIPNVSSAGELNKVSYLDQSPMDRLDEYLGTEDDYYPRSESVLPASYVSAPSESVYGVAGRPIQNQPLESKRDFLTSVKQAMKTKK